MYALTRMLVAGALAIGSIAVAGVAHGDTGPVPHTGPVPADWGEPTAELPFVTVTGRDSGRLPNRLGNQHVIQLTTADEEDIVRGAVYDWWCPVGDVAPDYPGEETTCRLKDQYNVDFDYAKANELVQSWSPKLRYMNLRMPVLLTDSVTGATIAAGKVSLRLKAAGSLSFTWYDGDYQAYLARDGAFVSGGTFMGEPWHDMTSVDVVENTITVQYGYAGT